MLGGISPWALPHPIPEPLAEARDAPSPGLLPTALSPLLLQPPCARTLIPAQDKISPLNPPSTPVIQEDEEDNDVPGECKQQA